MTGPDLKAVTSFIHPLSAAVPPCWASKSDWQIFKAIEAVACTPDEGLIEAQRSLILDPHDPEVIAAARQNGVPETWEMLADPMERRQATGFGFLEAPQRGL